MNALLVKPVIKVSQVLLIFYNDFQKLNYIYNFSGNSFALTIHFSTTKITSTTLYHRQCGATVGAFFFFGATVPRCHHGRLFNCPCMHMSMASDALTPPARRSCDG